jgi:hypothetical protein
MYVKTLYETSTAAKEVKFDSSCLCLDLSESSSR